jgi:hypothetical protein
MKTIIVKHPKYDVDLLCTIQSENGYFIVQNNILDIIGTGLTEAAAKESFCQEFDFIYQRYNQIEDNKLSNKILNIKNMINVLVEKIS